MIILNLKHKAQIKYDPETLYRKLQTVIIYGVNNIVIEITSYFKSPQTLYLEFSFNFH